RWAINGSAAASPAYIAERHRWLRACVAKSFGAVAAEEIRVLYGGSVSLQNAPALLQMQDVDGLFVGRSAWTASGYAELARLVAATVGTDVSDGLSYETATRKRGNHASGIGG
ncbi:MAG: triose-phosphate isomerase, partial [Deltaproteobacteria bacterium]|nr:triose-phosphate isomerase [Deltaproteobacteria bacterium]